MQLATLFLVDCFELLMLHPEPLLLQHDLLVEAEKNQQVHVVITHQIF